MCRIKTGGNLILLSDKSGKSLAGYYMEFADDEQIDGRVILWGGYEQQCSIQFTCIDLPDQALLLYAVF